jgi:hypothetical protein
MGSFLKPRSLIWTGAFLSVFLSGNFDHNQINSIIPTKVTAEAIAREQVTLKITSRDNDVTNVAFRFCGQRRHPKVYHIFRGSIARPVLPLSTLRPYPYEYKRMTWGRCGLLGLHRMELSSTTPHRF